MKQILPSISFFAFLLLCATGGTQAQKLKRYNTFSYNVNDGLLQSHVIDMAFDKNSFGWLSFENGIQKFDGNQFTPVAIQNGLPDDKAVKFLQGSNGDLFISHKYGISKYIIEGDKFKLLYAVGGSKKETPVFLGADAGIIYFYSGGIIIGLFETSGRQASAMQPHFIDSAADGQVRCSDNIMEHKVCIGSGNSFILWDLKSAKVIATSYRKKHSFLWNFYLKNGHAVVYFDYDGLADNVGQFSYDFNTGEDAFLSAITSVTGKPFRSQFYQWQGQTLTSQYNHLYETNMPGGEAPNEIVNLQNKSVSGNAVIFKILQDKYANLYLLTVNDGFRKIIKNNYPVKYYGTDEKDQNFITGLCADKTGNRILAGAYGNGLLIFDTLQHLIKHITILPDSSKSFSPNGIIKTGADTYLMFCWGQKYAWRISNNFSSFIKEPFSCAGGNKLDYINYYGNITMAGNRPAFFQTSGNFYGLLQGQYKKYHDAGSNIATGSIMINGNIATCAGDELIFIDTSTFNIIKHVPLANTGGVRCLAADEDGSIFIGCNKGLYKTDRNGNILFYMGKENGLPDECIYALATDKDGHVWCSSNRGIFRLGSGEILQLKKEDGLQENEFNTNVVAAAEDGELFFGGVNGISSFFPSAIKSFEENISIFITGIKVNNQAYNAKMAAWQIDKMSLPYDKNAVSFDFIAMANNNPAQYIYQYKMEGIDEQWIQNNSFQTVRYHLQPGSYIFKIAASRYFNKNAVPMKEIKIIIHPPVWRTWWFLSLLILSIAATCAYIFNSYNRRHYNRQLAVIENEKYMQQERERISRDLHDNIGAYANAVLYNTELLEKESDSLLKKELMSDLKFASKDIITSLRETIWAFKKDSYAAEECLLRVRNFVQALTRYYPHITFSVSGEAPENILLQNAVALNLVRIVQEAVTNAVKHSGTKKIFITNNISAHHWELAVADNGKGFGGRPAEGDGLQNMQQRALAAGFSIKIDSRVNDGTVITLIIKI